MKKRSIPTVRSPAAQRAAAVRTSSQASASPASAKVAAQPSTRLELVPSAALLTVETAERTPARPARGVRFGLFLPQAREVFVVGSFNEWNPRATPLQRDALGDWSVEIDLPRGEHRYRFVVDGEWRDDPTAQQTVQNPFGGFDAVAVVV